jgi:hypothetical protein
MSYKMPDGTFVVDPNGPIPIITFKTNQSKTHFHVQVQTSDGWALVVDAPGTAKSAPISGGPIGSAADFAGKRFLWDVTLVTESETDPVEAVLEVLVKQGGQTIFDSGKDDHQITGQETYYEFLDAN